MYKMRYSITYVLRYIGLKNRLLFHSIFSSDFSQEVLSNFPALLSKLKDVRLSLKSPPHRSSHSKAVMARPRGTEESAGSANSPSRGRQAWMASERCDSWVWPRGRKGSPARAPFPSPRRRLPNIWDLGLRVGDPPFVTLEIFATTMSNMPC